MKTIAELLAAEDTEIMRLLGVNRVMLYKWRKGVECPNAAQLRILREHDEFVNRPPPADFKNPDYTHPAFDEYETWFQQSIADRGFEDVYIAWTAGSACGCMGPQNGAPFCGCKMRYLTAQRHGKVVQITAET